GTKPAVWRFSSITVRRSSGTSAGSGTGNRLIASVIGSSRLRAAERALAKIALRRLANAKRLELGPEVLRLPRGILRIPHVGKADHLPGRPEPLEGLKRVDQDAPLQLGIVRLARLM